MIKPKSMFALFCLMFVAGCTVAIAPSLAKIGLSFPDVSRSTLQMLLSFGAFSSFGVSLFVGKIQQYISQKTVITVGAFLISTGMIGFFYTTSFTLLLVLSLLMGVGSGAMTATIPALLSTYFVGEKRSIMLGRNVSLQAIGSMLLTSLGGTLAIYGWRYNYLMFAIALVSGVVGLFLLPNDKKIENQDDDEEATGSELASEEDDKLSMTSPTILTVLMLASMIMFLLSCSQNNLAIHASDLNIGNSSLVGLALSCESLGAIIAGFFITKLSVVLKGNTLIFGYVLMTLGNASISFIHLTVGFFIGTILIGMSMGSLMTRTLYLLTSGVKKSAIPTTAGLFSAVTSLGFALAPLIYNSIAGLISDSLATTSFYLATLFGVILILILAVTRFETRLLKLIKF